MQIQLSTDTDRVSRVFREIMRDQAPFAMAVAINETAKHAQNKQRKHQRNVFHVRRPTFVDRGVKIKPFAKKAEPVAVIQIDPPGGQRRRSVLTRHEEDTQREPVRGDTLTVPAQQGSARVIRRRSDPLHPRRWKMKRMDKGNTKMEVYQGAQGLYMIRAPDGTGAVRQRTGSGRHASHAGTVTVYTFHRDTPLDPKLSFVANVEQVVTEHWDRHIAEAWDKALRTAR